MEPPIKKRKVGEFTKLPTEIVNKVLTFVNKSDLKNVYMLNKQIYQETSRIHKDKTYFYLLQPNAKLNEILETQRQFNEIFFHGKHDSKDIKEILTKFGSQLKILTFGKCDLSFIKVPASDIIEWYNLTTSLTHLNTGNLDIIHFTTKDTFVNFPSLKKLRCGDPMLQLIDAPNLVKIKIFSTVLLTSHKLQKMNEFFKRHYAIKYISYTLYNCEDIDVQNCAFELSHLKLNNLRFHEFRYDINAVITILKNQPDLIELRLEDGSYSETQEDVDRVAGFQPLFNEMIKLKKLEKLYVEMPSEQLLLLIPIKLKNLKVLKICSISMEMLDTFLSIKNHNVERLCIENLENGKKHLTIDHIKNVAKSYKNLKAFKADTLPQTVLNSITIHMKNLKKLTIIRNEHLPNKMKKSFNESVIMQQSNLERITCKYEDYKLRIFPLIQVCHELKHVRIYWDNKNTPFMQIIFEIIMACPEIILIDFPFDGVFIKANIIAFENHFAFTFKNREYEVTISRKKGKIICKKIN